MDPELQALEAELAALQRAMNEPSAAPATEEPSFSAYDLLVSGPKQRLFDVLTGAGKAYAGAADIVSYPVVKGLEYAGAPVETFALSKMLGAGAEAAAPMLGVEPETELQKLAEFAAPIPGPGKARILGDVGYGALGYAGSKLGEYLAPDSPGAQLAYTLGLPLGTAAGIGAARRATQVAVPSVGVLTGQEDALRELARQEVVQSLGEEGAARLAVAQQMPELAVGTGGVPLTAAEIAQTPSAAKYQQAIRQTQEGGNVLEQALQARQTEISGTLERLGTTPAQGELSLALRETAAEAAKSKEVQTSAILDKLGLAPEIRAQTTTERGAVLLSGLTEQKKEAKQLVDKAWKAVPKKTKVDAGYALNQALRDFRSFDPLELNTVSGTGKEVMREVSRLLETRDGRINIGKLQALRSTAGAAVKEASGKNPREVALMQTLREDLDLIGVEQILTKKADAPKTAIEKLKEAITARREFGEKFERGATGELLKVRRLEPVVKASKAIDRALKSPENVTEILGKFGRQSDEAIVLRSELLSRLEQQKDAVKYVSKNEELFKRAFEDDYSSIVDYAQKKVSKAPLEEYAKITEAAIPNKIFADEVSAGKFAEQFKDTPILDYGRGKFISDRLLKGKSPLTNLETNKPIAAKLFGEELPGLETVVRDLEISKSPEALQRLAVAGNSITSVAQTSLGAIKNGRAAINLLRTGKLTAPLAGALAGIPGAALGSPVESIAGTLIGLKLGSWADNLASVREADINRFAAELLANPKLIGLASAPPTDANIDALMRLGQRLGYIAVKAGDPSAESAQEPQTATPTALEQDPELLQLEAELESLRSMMQESVPAPESVKVGKQNISIPTGEKYAPPSLVKAVIQVESAGKPEAVSSKGAGGLMQLMPATAKQLGVADRFDPEQNVEGGSRYLQQMLNKYGKTDIALAAYNWGPGNVDKAIRQVKADGKRVTWANIMQAVKVPQETRLYVNKVLSKEETLTEKTSPSLLRTVASFAPVTGEIISAQDAINALQEGEYSSAAINALGVIPAVGLFNRIRKGAKLVDAVSDVAKAAPLTEADILYNRANKALRDIDIDSLASSLKSKQTLQSTYAELVEKTRARLARGFNKGKSKSWMDEQVAYLNENKAKLDAITTEINDTQQLLQNVIGLKQVK